MKRGASVWFLVVFALGCAVAAAACAAAERWGIAVGFGWVAACAGLVAFVDNGQSRHRTRRLRQEREESHAAQLKAWREGDTERWLKAAVRTDQLDTALRQLEAPW